MKTIDIKGKDYVTVNERIKYFRENFAGYSMLSEVVFFNESKIVETETTKEGKTLKGKDAEVLIKACIINPEGKPVAQGLAYEKEGSTFINKTSFVENCETSAWGRALANFGIGIDSNVSSADEVVNSINNK